MNHLRLAKYQDIMLITNDQIGMLVTRFTLIY